MALDEVRMSRVRVVCAVRVHNTLRVRQLTRIDIGITSTAGRVPEKKEISSGGS